MVVCKIGWKPFHCGWRNPKSCAAILHSLFYFILCRPDDVTIFLMFLVNNFRGMSLLIAILYMGIDFVWADGQRRGPISRGQKGHSTIFSIPDAGQHTSRRERRGVLKGALQPASHRQSPTAQPHTQLPSIVSDTHVATTAACARGTNDADEANDTAVPRWAASRCVTSEPVPLDKLLRRQDLLGGLSGGLWHDISGGLAHDEAVLLVKYFRNASSVMEWGMGSSTMLAANFNVPRLTAVDSDADWVRYTRNRTQRPFYRFVHAYIGVVSDWGVPVDRKSADLWPFYQIGAISAEIPFDVYLVDGRFRVACGCVALLHGGPQATVIMHDFGVREWYHSILTVADRVEQVGNLIVLRRRPSVKEDEIRSLWKRYKHDYR